MSRVHDALKKAEQEKVLLGEPESTVEMPTPMAPGLHQREAASGAVSERPFAKAESPAGQVEAPGAFLARCSHQEWKTDATLTRHVDARRHTLVSEEFRSLRSRLYFMRKARPLQKLLVTSPLPNEGKTFLAANLARVIAKQPETRVLLIDGDLRMCSLNAVMGAPQEPGLTQYLAGGLDITSVIQRGPTENLFFIPGGATASNPTELFGNGRLEFLLEQVTQVFDWIIFDSPPTIPVSDSRLLAAFCDGVLMLVNAGTTPFDLAQRACAEFPKDQLLGVIINRVDQHHTYGSYYYYGKKDHHKGNGKGAKV